MTGFELIELMQQRLGDSGSRVYYTESICLRFLNFAQAFLATLPQFTIRARTATTITGLSCFVDLRTVIPRHLALTRVMLGNVVTQQESLAYGVTRRLHRITLDALAARRNWIAALGVPRLYCLHGATLLGVYPRPTADTVITLVARTLPAPYTAGTLGQECEHQSSTHSQIADVSTGLILLREGTIEGSKGVGMLAQVLPAQMLEGLAKSISGLKKAAVDRKQAEAGAVVQTV